MIHVCDNTCPICLKENLDWNIDIRKSKMHMFKCGHGTCKDCYTELISKCDVFKCPTCRENGQKHYINLDGSKEWITFSQWYSEYEIFIKNGHAKNVIKNSVFGQQLIRLIRENKPKPNTKLNTKPNIKPKKCN